jgi:oligoendopeptidase F
MRAATQFFFPSHDLECTVSKNTDRNREVASMSMELFSMDHGRYILIMKKNARAKEQHLERVITIFPGLPRIDKFQHWIYEKSRSTAIRKELKGG